MARYVSVSAVHGKQQGYRQNVHPLNAVQPQHTQQQAVCVAAHTQWPLSSHTLRGLEQQQLAPPTGRAPVPSPSAGALTHG
jgi:hypothetical protein